MVIRTLNDIYLDLRNKLIKENRLQADLEAREVCVCGTGIERDQFDKSRSIFMSEESAEKINALFSRLISGEPLPYIIGEWDFFSLTFKTPRGVLIPRPDTESLVEAALKATKRKTPLRVLDLCCGTGCVGIAYATQMPSVKVVLADISSDALKAAKENILMHNLSGTVYPLHLDITEGYRPEFGKFDLILANPPYIPTDEISQLDQSVRDFEPHLALDGGPDGLSFYRILSEKWKDALNPGGILLVECGMNQSEQVKAIMKQASYKMLRVYKDLTGVERVVSGRTKN
ncbi:MAG: peptide chain release factor N(5)-glutamine methyltransferase [Clostridiales bacterium]|nr:peptide chain release factor N(5)-glutamine methyltransferase [Clostridiales bacterium]